MTVKIALAGPKGGGKTWLMNEVGQKLEFKLQSLKLSKDIPPISTLAFADTIYECQLDLFDFLNQTNMKAREFNEWLKGSGMDDKIHPVIGMSPRHFRQHFGTEFARSENPSIWVDIIRDKVKAIEDDEYTAIVLLDVRFPNEVMYCKEQGFDLIYVNTMEAIERGSHDSEAHSGLIKKHTDTIIKSKAEANMTVDKIVNDLVVCIEDNYTDSGLIVPKGKLN